MIRALPVRHPTNPRILIPGVLSPPTTPPLLLPLALLLLLRCPVAVLAVECRSHADCAAGHYCAIVSEGMASAACADIWTKCQHHTISPGSIDDEVDSFDSPRARVELGCKALASAGGCCSVEFRQRCSWYNVTSNADPAECEAVDKECASNHRPVECPSRWGGLLGLPLLILILLGLFCARVRVWASMNVRKTCLVGPEGRERAGAGDDPSWEEEGEVGAWERAQAWGGEPELEPKPKSNAEDRQRHQRDAANSLSQGKSSIVPELEPESDEPVQGKSRWGIRSKSGRRLEAKAIEVQILTCAEGETLKLPRGRGLARAFWGDPAAPWDSTRGALVTVPCRYALTQAGGGGAGRLVATSAHLGDPFKVLGLRGVEKVLIVELKPRQLIPRQVRFLDPGLARLLLTYFPVSDRAPSARRALEAGAAVKKREGNTPGVKHCGRSGPRRLRALQARSMDR